MFKQAIDTLIVNYNTNVDVKSLRLSVPNKEIINDKEFFVCMFVFIK